jgi:NAD(P)-dependent dehydrogenase (short-subunit alcohol dehydrogenase family)
MSDTDSARRATYPSLADRVVLITGGGSGIGAAFVERFHEQGAKVAFFDIDDDASRMLVDRLVHTHVSTPVSTPVDGPASRLEDRHPEAPATRRHRPLYLHCDLGDIDDVRSSVAMVEQQLGPVRALINNAARDERKGFFDVTPEFWDRMLAVNLRHQFFVTQAVAKGMIDAGGGSVIMMGSISWMRGMPGMSAYTTSKAGINGLTRTLARELGDRNIRVNSIVPGAVVTERQKALWLKPGDDEKFLAQQSLKFRLQPEEIARVALFLASDESRGMAGQNLIVDAGIV